MTIKEENITIMSFEQALKELELIVRKLEAGQSELESSIADYARGTALKEHCQKRLTNAKMKVEKIMQAGDGSFATMSFEEK